MLQEKEVIPVGVSFIELKRKELFYLKAIERPTPEDLLQIQNLELSIQLGDLLTGLATHMPEIRDRTTKAKLALSIITKITTDEEDAAAEELLVMARNTYEHCSNMRKDYTEGLELLKKDVMIYEKSISNLKTDEGVSEYLRVKKLRDNWATAKAKIKADELAKIKKDQDASEEKIRLSSLFELRFAENINSAISKVEEGIILYYNNLTLDEYERKIAKFSLTPKLQEATYESWFIVEYNKLKLTEEEFNVFMNEEVKPEYLYEEQNKAYAERVSVILEQWKKKLPGKKIELEKLAELERTNKEAADLEKENLRIKNEKEEEERKKKAEAEALAIRSTIQTNQRAASLESSFYAQVKIDNVADTSGGTRTTKVAIVNVPKAKVVDTFARIMFSCFVHPEFKGYIKKDKQGNELPADENGIPQYTDWANELLTFFAKNCATAIEGVEIKEIISTVQKSKKI